MPAQVQRRLQGGQQGGRHQCGLCAAVAHHEGIVFGSEQGVDCHWHHPCVQGAQKGHHPVAAVVHEQKHALFTLQAHFLQAARKATHLFSQLAVSELTGIVDQRDFVGAFGVGCQQVLGEIEGALGRLNVGHGCLRGSVFVSIVRLLEVGAYRVYSGKATPCAASRSSAWLLPWMAARRW